MSFRSINLTALAPHFIHIYLHVLKIDHVDKLKKTINDMYTCVYSLTTFVYNAYTRNHVPVAANINDGLYSRI